MVPGGVAAAIFMIPDLFPAEFDLDAKNTVRDREDKPNAGIEMVNIFPIWDRNTQLKPTRGVLCAAKTSIKRSSTSSRRSIHA